MILEQFYFFLEQKNYKKCLFNTQPYILKKYDINFDQQLSQ